MSIEVTMRHSDVRIESMKEYAEKRMALLKERFPKVTKAAIVIDVDVKKHMYMAEVVANRLGETAVGAKEFSESAKSVIDAAAARAERQLLKMRVKARKGTVRQQRAASAKNKRRSGVSPLEKKGEAASRRLRRKENRRLAA